LKLKAQKAKNILFAPWLVDPNSFLESPFNVKEENTLTLIEKATVSG
tara:strand:+ start:195 stop:335 length:141 start_codon:yes stop_codon:yes gene_type:complete